MKINGIDASPTPVINDSAFAPEASEKQPTLRHSEDNPTCIAWLNVLLRKMKSSRIDAVRPTQRGAVG